MNSFVRGSTINFRASCTDAAGEPFTPAEAELSLSYVIASGREHAQTRHTMMIAGNVVSCTWDSSVAAPGTVTWNIRASGVVQDGALVLTAMDANLR